MDAETVLDCARSPLRLGVNLVEASAGTGKTYAIAMLVLRAVAEQAIPIDQVLVVTFTKAATEELRSRIRQRLVEARDLLAGGVSRDETLVNWAATVSEPAPAVARLREALALIDRAAIFTIHSFCKRMLSEQALESGQLFDGELVGDVRELRAQVVEDFWRHHLYRLPPALCGIITAELPTPEALEKSIASSGLAQARIEPETPPFQEAAAACGGAIERLAGWWRESSALLYERLQAASKAGQLKKVLAEGLDDWWRGLERLLLGHGGRPDHLLWLTRQGLAEALNGTKFRKINKEDFLADWPLPEAEATVLIGAASQIVLALRRELAATLATELERRLERQGWLSYDDLITRFDRAVAGGTIQLQQRLSERFKAALIDEFQDTDSAQWRIFSTLFGDGNHYLYLIGDPKQAIYRFRGADIFSYFEAKETSTHQSTLERNFRSHPLLVAGVNQLFTRRMRPFFFEETMLPFRPVAAAKSASDGELCENGAVLPVLVHCQLEASSKKDGLWSAGAAAERFLAFTVSEICRLLAPRRQCTVCKERDGERTVRPVAARDIAVLVRSHRQAEAYLEALAEAGVPAVLNSRQSVFETGEARELLTVLAGVAAPGDITAVKRAMTVSWFGLSGNELLAIWQDDGRLDDCLNRFQTYHQLWRERGFLTMMNRLLAEEEVYLEVAREPRAERRIANIHHLLELVQEKETAEKFGPERTMVWLQAALSGREGEEDRELRLESDEEAVRIVTMHSAKGLQYPVVFCPYLWHRSARDGSAPVASCHEDGGLVIDLGSPELENRRRLAMEESLAEDLRLAYVALTRAELCCYLMWGAVSKHGNSVASSFESALGYLLFPEGPVDFAAQAARLEELAASPGAARVLVPAEGDFEVEHLGPSPAAPSLAAQAPGARSLVTDYQMSSYSAMAALSEQEDHGAESPSEPGSGSAILNRGLPAGARFGNLIHDALETLPFAELATAGARTAELKHLCRRYGATGSVVTVQALLATIVTSRLSPVADGFCLSELGGKMLVSEMPFYFHMRHLDTRKVNTVLAGQPGVIPLATRTMQGYLTGFIDLFCCHRGRYYLLDYKTNYLGDRLDDYRPERLEAAMASHNYGLQYWIYTLVLHRYLAGALSDYRFERDFGGVFYLFVRGMTPAIPGHGVFSAMPPLAVLEQLDEAIGGKK